MQYKQLEDLLLLQPFSSSLSCICHHWSGDVEFLALSGTVLFGLEDSPVTRGHKFSWPELFGKKQAEAQATIQRDNPEVKVVILSPGRARLFDFCCNRVYLDVDGSGIVTKTPTVG
ncbi:hypothetical protein V6N12_070092 [Hibiscus sabdariffa]|uniref:Proteinase inhibitor n=1 Tax=Hibiscus sabdariffa TaxID=183260 RepID=A0ABR2FGA2_9ROSI